MSCSGDDVGAGSYEVVSEDLAAAAGRIRDAVSPMACWSMPRGGVTPASVGHDQVAQTWGNLCQALSEQAAELSRLTSSHASRLDEAAAAYDASDAAVFEAFTSFGRQPGAQP